jgi:hypothetical protein
MFDLCPLTAGILKYAAFFKVEKNFWWPKALAALERTLSIKAANTFPRLSFPALQGRVNIDIDGTV